MANKYDKIKWFFIALMVLGGGLFSMVTSQSVIRVATLDSCILLAKENYPLVAQYDMILNSGSYSKANTSKMSWPQVMVSGQATYQSDVTGIPFQLPGMEIPTVSRDQYRLFGEVSQSFTDIYTVKDQKNIITNKTNIETQKLEVDFYKLEEKIQQIYFAILLLESQIQQNDILKTDLTTGKEKLNVAIQNGVALQMGADQLQAEYLKAEQKSLELSSSKKVYIDMLSAFTQRPFNEETRFEKPVFIDKSNTINRPELKLLLLQQLDMDFQTRLIKNRTLPKFSAFFQAGIGRPALNMLSNDVEPYYIGGLRLMWNISGYYTLHKEKQILEINKNMLEAQKETFLLNTTVQMKQQEEEITKLTALIDKDNEIIALREKVKNISKVQLESGVITVNDFLNNVHIEDLSRQSKVVHEIQKLMAMYQLKTISGN